MDWFESTAIAVLSGTGRQAYKQIHHRLKTHKVTRLGSRWQNRNLTLFVKLHIHENIESGWDIVLR